MTAGFDLCDSFETKARGCVVCKRRRKATRFASVPGRGADVRSWPETEVDTECGKRTDGLQSDFAARCSTIIEAGTSEHLRRPSAAGRDVSSAVGERNRIETAFV